MKISQQTTANSGIQYIHTYIDVTY